MKKIYVIVETYQDYKGAYSTVWGAAATSRKAHKILRDSIKERFEGYLDENPNFVEDSFVNEKTWSFFDGDSVTEFRIHTTSM